MQEKSDVVFILSKGLVKSRPAAREGSAPYRHDLFLWQMQDTWEAEAANMIQISYYKPVLNKRMVIEFGIRVLKEQKRGKK